LIEKRSIKLPQRLAQEVDVYYSIVDVEDEDRERERETPTARFNKQPSASRARVL